MGDEKASSTATFYPVLEIMSPSGSISTHYPLVYNDLPDEFRLRASMELKETDEKRRKGIQELKEFMRKHGIAELDDIWLKAILRNCKYNMKKSSSKLKRFAAVRREIAIEISKIPMSTIEKVYDSMSIGLFPYRDREGRAILFSRPYSVDLEKYSLDDGYPCMMALILFLLSFPITTVAGLAWFGECRAPSAYLFCGILHKLRPCAYHVLRMPCRIGRMEILNPNKLASCCYAAMCPILPKFIKDRITFHDNEYEDVCKTYNPEIIPEEFGGKMGPMSNESYRKELLEFVENLRSENI